MVENLEKCLEVELGLVLADGFVELLLEEGNVLFVPLVEQE